MKKDWKRHIAYEVLLILVMLTLLMYLCRLWPIIFLLIIGIFITALRLLFLSPKRVEVVEPLPLPALPEPKEPTEKDVKDLAYSVILRRITELVTTEYPEARWVWEAANARQLIELGEDVFILLNRAGGFRRAHVVIQNLQVVTIEYNHAPANAVDPDEDDTDTDEPQEENFDLVAFEWAEAHIMELNKRCNEAIGEGMTEIILTSEELPVKESWPAICKQLMENGLDDVKCIPQGIVFDDMLYLEVQKIVTKHNGDKKTVKLESNHFPMSFTNPISYLEQAAMFK